MANFSFLLTTSPICLRSHLTASKKASCPYQEVDSSGDAACSYVVALTSLRQACTCQLISRGLEGALGRVLMTALSETLEDMMHLRKGSEAIQAPSL